MKNKVFKVIIVSIIILTMTMANLLFVGYGLISYAVDDNNTNNNNVQFSSYFKNEKGEKVTELNLPSNNLETSLYLYINVKNEGYLNAEIDLKDSNFRVKSSTSEFVNTIKDNVVKLNHINAGTEAEVELKVEFIKKEEMDTSFLNKESEIKLTGIYKDSSEKNKEIKATKKITLKLVSSKAEENAKNELEIITNKILKLNGENKRVIQVSLKTGLKDNSYPIKNITSQISVPKEEEVKEVKNYIKMNNMTKWNLEKSENNVNINMENERVLWKASGDEEIILTYIYDEDINLEEAEITANTTIQLYDETTIQANTSKVKINTEEKDKVIVAEVENEETSIYKGKLNQGIEKTIKQTTKIDINLAEAIEEIELKEMPNTYNNGVDANTYYAQTLINKENLNKVLGETGSLKILDNEGNIIEELNKDSESDDKGNIIINYEKDTIKEISVQITKPEKEGIVNLENTKVIEKTEKQVVSSATSINTDYSYKYNDEKNIEQGQSKLDLKETTTVVDATISKDKLSTLTTNNIEISAILKSSNEENDLYKNPTIILILH